MESPYHSYWAHRLQTREAHAPQRERAHTLQWRPSTREKSAIESKSLIDILRSEWRLVTCSKMHRCDRESDILILIYKSYGNQWIMHLQIFREEEIRLSWTFKWSIQCGNCLTYIYSQPESEADTETWVDSIRTPWGVLSCPLPVTDSIIVLTARCLGIDRFPVTLPCFCSWLWHKLGKEKL